MPGALLAAGEVGAEHAEWYMDNLGCRGVRAPRLLRALVAKGFVPAKNPVLMARAPRPARPAPRAPRA